jgi:2-succinyl-6-hydroxy-2,4-cyclohexadiene-1-carboxylate synthase
VTSPPVVVLHGFAGHGDSWRAIRGLLPERRVEAITLFGHDQTAPPDAPVAFESEVTRVVELIRGLGAPVRLCGYSMGGRISLGVLGRAPELVESAILVGAHPGLTSDAEREQRVQSDEVWVRVLEDEGIAVFAEKWQAQALFASQARLDPERLAAQRAIRVRHAPHSLALAMTSLGLARMPSYWDVLERIRVPLDIVVGALDTKFTALAVRMNERVAGEHGRVLAVAGAGHNVLLEEPELLAQVIAGERTTPLAPGLTAV